MGKKDVVYVVASRLGSIGMGSTAYQALKGIENSGLKYKAFSRGYSGDVELNKNNLTNYSFLEYFSYPFRFLEKYFGIRINSFRIVNNFFGKLVEKNLPKAKIYHTWIYVAPEAIKKAKKEGSVMILEGANSHPLNVAKIMNKEYKKNSMSGYVVDEEEIKKKTKIYNCFDYVMCPSDFVYDSFLSQGFSKEKLIKMPYGVDVKRFSQKENYPKKGEKIRFVFVGSIQLRKGLPYLLEAWKELGLENAKLVIVGRVWPDAQKIVKEYEGTKNVKFVGFAKPEKILRDSDVFVSPSLEEGSALTCYEAMACGLPLIATYNTGSIIKDKKEGFIIPAGNVEELKEKIKYFYDNPKQIEKMGKAARKKVEGYSWEDYGDRLSKFYLGVLGK
jgi:glycosyltransferase involved in cell wall biosynthesis